MMYGGLRRDTTTRLPTFFFFPFSEHSVRDFGELLRRAGPSCCFSCYSFLVNYSFSFFTFFSFFFILPRIPFLSGWRACMFDHRVLYFFFFSFCFFFFSFCFLIFSVYVISLNLAKRGTLKSFLCFGAMPLILRAVIVLSSVNWTEGIMTNQSHMEH
ncbi:hypothetical protein VTN31DRAFT_3219 [Thermomyces dupontii]|uniref:uncharacterized protein n=1 Tax=Talaromyces thermophilus TaxID=28565 RepID=UPI0037436AE2